MFGKLGLGRARALFAEQFEQSGAGFLYRKSRKGAPIAVTAEERDRYIAAYAVFTRYGFWVMIAAVLILSFAAASLGQAGRALPDSAFTAGTLLICLLFLAAHYWAWNAPMRELRGRGFAGPAPSPEEAARQTFARITWPQLGLGLVAAAYLILRYGVGDNWDLSRNGLVLGVAVLIMAVILFQAFRKWRIERRA